MKRWQIWVCGIVVASGCFCYWLVRMFELDFATDVADSFLQAAMTSDVSSTFGMASTSYQTRLPRTAKDSMKFDLLPRETKSWSWNYAKARISANAGQVLLFGWFKVARWPSGPGGAIAQLERAAKAMDAPLIEVNFRVVLIKESGVWKIDVLSYDREIPGDPP